jgi:hypothetical protein
VEWDASYIWQQQSRLAEAAVNLKAPDRFTRSAADIAEEESFVRHFKRLREDRKEAKLSSEIPEEADSSDADEAMLIPIATVAAEAHNGLVPKVSKGGGKGETTAGVQQKGNTGNAKDKGRDPAKELSRLRSKEQSKDTQPLSEVAKGSDGRPGRTDHRRPSKADRTNSKAGKDLGKGPTSTVGGEVSNGPPAAPPPLARRGEEDEMGVDQEGKQGFVPHHEPESQMHMQAFVPGSHRLIFPTAKFNDVDLVAFERELRDAMVQQCGAKQSTLNSVSIVLSQGSIIATLTGDPSAIAELVALPLERLTVLGYKVGTEAKVAEAPAWWQAAPSAASAPMTNPGATTHAALASPTAPASRQMLGRQTRSESPPPLEDCWGVLEETLERPGTAGELMSTPWSDGVMTHVDCARAQSLSRSSGKRCSRTSLKQQDLPLDGPKKQQDQHVSNWTDECRKMQIQALEKQLAAEREGHQAADEKCTQMEKLLERYRKELAESKRSRFGVMDFESSAYKAKVVPYNQRVISPDVRSPHRRAVRVRARTRSPKKAAARTMPTRVAANVNAATSGHMPLNPSEVDPLRTASLHQAAKNSVAASRERVAAIQLLERRGHDTFDLRRQEKVCRLQDLSAFPEGMWDAFHDWKHQAAGVEYPV